MKVPLYNIKAEAIGEVELPDAVFNRPWNSDLVHQAVVMYAANLRKPIAHTKTRGEVSGGGKKPWRQKGTGRARHGSTRSPIWIHGGVTFGPRNDKEFGKRMNKKMRRAALTSALSEYVRRDNLKVVSGLKVEEPKTKHVQKILRAFFNSPKRPNVLFVTQANEKNFFQASRNIPRTGTTGSTSLNTHILMQHQVILIDKDAILELAKNSI